MRRSGCIGGSVTPAAAAVSTTRRPPRRRSGTRNRRHRLLPRRHARARDVLSGCRGTSACRSSSRSTGTGVERGAAGVLRPWVGAARASTWRTSSGSSRARLPRAADYHLLVERGRVASRSTIRSPLAAVDRRALRVGRGRVWREPDRRPAHRRERRRRAGRQPIKSRAASSSCRTPTPPRRRRCRAAAIEAGARGPRLPLEQIAADLGRALTPSRQERTRTRLGSAIESCEHPPRRRRAGEPSRPGVDPRAAQRESGSRDSGREALRHTARGRFRRDPARRADARDRRLRDRELLRSAQVARHADHLPHRDQQDRSACLRGYDLGAVDYLFKPFHADDPAGEGQRLRGTA